MTQKQAVTKQPVRDVEKAAAAAAYLASQEITITMCPECGNEVAGLNNRYACSVCSWCSHWSQGSKELPTAADDPDAVQVDL